MPIFIVETAAISPIREYWRVEAATAEEAAETYGDKGECLYDEVLGEEEGSQVSEVHPYGALAGFFAAEAARKEAPTMLEALRKISQGADCFTFNSDADTFRFVDMVAEIVAPILSRIDGAPTAQPSAPSGEAARPTYAELANAARDAAEWFASGGEVGGCLLDDSEMAARFAGLVEAMGGEG